MKTKKIIMLFAFIILTTGCGISNKEFGYKCFRQNIDNPYPYFALKQTDDKIYLNYVTNISSDTIEMYNNKKEEYFNIRNIIFNDEKLQTLTVTYNKQTDYADMKAAIERYESLGNECKKVEWNNTCALYFKYVCDENSVLGKFVNQKLIYSNGECGETNDGSLEEGLPDGCVGYNIYIQN